MELLSSIGLAIAVILIVLGADRVIRWMVSGYHLEQKHIRLGKGCVLIADTDLVERER